MFTIIDKKAKRKGFKNTHYLYKNYCHANHFGMISTIHTFGRDLKWNPHIHALVPELIFDPDKNEIKTFHHFDFKKLRNTFMFELLRLIEEKIGPSFKKDKAILYSKHKNGFYVYARTITTDKEYAEKNNTKNINACITYSMRYVGRPAMAESRIIEYAKEEDTVEWFYHDHRDEKKYSLKKMQNHLYRNCLFIFPMRIFVLFATMAFIQTKQEKNLTTFMNCLVIKRNKITLKRLVKKSGRTD